MKENVLDVLMYLFETYVDTEEEPEADQNELRDELARAGFGDPEIDRALDWLDGLTDHQDNLSYHSQTAHGTRIYSDFEQERLDAQSRPAGIVTSTDLMDEPRGDLEVADIMTEDVITVPQYDPVHVAARVMRNRGVHHLVVTHEGEIVGILSSFDLLKVIEEHRFKVGNPPAENQLKNKKR